MPSPNVSGVSLPSIRDMFPEHLLRSPPQYRERPTFQQQPPNPLRSHPERSIHPHGFSPVPSNRNMYDVHSSRSRYSSQHPQGAGSPSPTSIYHEHPSVSNHRSVQPGRRSDPHEFSFNVLRSDPTSSSLEHLVSSSTLPNRGVNAGGHSPQDRIASGSTPAFKVSVSPVMPSRTGPSASKDRMKYDSTSSTVIHPREVTKSFRASSSESPYPRIISFPISNSTSSSDPSQPDILNDLGNASDDDSPSESTVGKKHVCTTCNKRFNRPSSLRIHVNTHTGDTPFRCPWPNCGREFNVNSNMRRHYRNHTTPGFSRTQPADNRRRRRRIAPSPSHAYVVPSSSPTSKRAKAGYYVASPTFSTFSTSDSEDEVSNTGMYYKPEVDEEEQLFHYEPNMNETENHREASSLVHSMARVAVVSDRPMVGRERAYSLRQQEGSRSRLRALTPGSTIQSSSPSPSTSPSPPLPDRMYNPSLPYLHSVTDSRVSTALRPAFHPSRPSFEGQIKMEHMSNAR